MATEAAERMRILRERRREGIRVLRIPVCIETVETLVETDYLQVEDVHDLEAVSAALVRFIDDATGSVTCHAITLDTW